jgi:hypothetical protein
MTRFHETTLSTVFKRKYKQACEARAKERATFSAAYAQRYGWRVAIHYPSDLYQLPEFCD